MKEENRDRRSTDSQIGYLMGKVESLEDKFEAHIRCEDKYFSNIASDITDIKKCIDTRLGKIENQLSMYRHFILFIKIFGAMSVALVTFKWGAVKLAINNFINF